MAARSVDASATVVSDGVDSDGDGTAGIEPGDTVVVWVAMGAEGKMTATIFERTAGQGLFRQRREASGSPG